MLPACEAMTGPIRDDSRLDRPARTESPWNAAFSIVSNPVTPPATPPAANPGIFPDKIGATDPVRCFGTTSSPGSSIAGTMSPPPYPGMNRPVCAMIGIDPAPWEMMWVTGAAAGLTYWKAAAAPAGVYGVT